MRLFEVMWPAIQAGNAPASAQRGAGSHHFLASARSHSSPGTAASPIISIAFKFHKRDTTRGETSLLPEARDE